MNKSSLFTLFIGAIFVVIIAEMMVNGYIGVPVKSDGTANVLKPAFPSQQVAASSGTITTSLLSSSGLQGLDLKAVAYGGKILDRIDFPAVSGVPVFESHLMKNEVVQVASFYEFEAGTQQTAGEVYELLKLKSAGELGAILNETNSFGEASFYVNYYAVPEKVFFSSSQGRASFWPDV